MLTQVANSLVGRGVPGTEGGSPLCVGTEGSRGSRLPLHSFGGLPQLCRHPCEACRKRLPRTNVGGILPGGAIHPPPAPGTNTKWGDHRSF